MNKKLLLLGTCLLMGAGTVSAQKRVTGRVVDASGHPVIGATVRVAGTKTITTTDGDGNFSLSNVPASAKHLDISYIGMKPQTVSVAGNVQVVMEDSNILEEAMVTAYGKTTKAAFTGAATQIKGEKIIEKNTTEITKALQGEVAGVQVINGSGQPGSSASIVIRGIGSVNSSSAPLYVVDGVPYSGYAASIDPQDIESMNIMKDATASALYGARGANGVIIITTRKGKKGKMNVDAEVKYGVSGRWIPTYNVIDSPERYLELSWESVRNNLMYSESNPFGQMLSAEDAAAMTNRYLFDEDGAYNGIGMPLRYNIWNAAGSELINPETGLFNPGITRRYTPEDWKDHLFRTGQKVEGNVRFSGGTDNVQYYTSLSYTKDKGYLIGSDFERFNARTNVNAQMTNWLSGSFNMSYSTMESNSPVQDANVSNNAIQFSNNIPSIYPVFQHDENGNLIEDTKLGGWAYDYGNTAGEGRAYAMGINPAGAANLDIARSKDHQFAGTGMLEASFLKDFRFSVSLGYTYTNAQADELTNPYYGDAEGLGRIAKQNSSSQDVTLNQILRWNHTYNNVHNLSAFAGHEIYWSQSSYMYGMMDKIVRADNTEFDNAIIMSQMSSATTQYALESWFGQVSYDYDSKYFFNASLRSDGSSRFAKGHRWGTFGAVSAAWNITREDFMRALPWVKNLKLKTSWGLTGNQSFSTDNSTVNLYPYHDLYSISKMNDEASFTLAYRGNKNLTWEKSSNFNVGLEFNVLNYVEGEINYFNRLTRDMLFLKSVAPSLGFTSYPVNEGKLRNSGFEFALTGHVLKTKNISVDIRVNGSHYKNEMVEMPIDPATGQPQSFRINSGYGWSKGHSLYDFYMREYAGVDPETGLALYNTYYDHKNLNAQGQPTPVTDMETYKVNNPDADIRLGEPTSEYADATRKYVDETAIPTISGGFGFDVRLYDFELSATFSYSLGGKAYDNVYAGLMSDPTIGSNNWHKDIQSRWQKPGDITDVPALMNGTATYTNSVSTRFLTSRNYLNLSSVRLAYNVPEKWVRYIHATGVQLYATGENLFLLSARKGFMPQSSFSGASSDTQYMPSSNVTFGLKLNF